MKNTVAGFSTATTANVEVEDLSYFVGTKELFREAELHASNGERVTIVGENGVGKSTFLRILAGQITDYDGTVRCPKTIGYLPQSFETYDDEPFIKHLLYACEKPEWIEHYHQSKGDFSREWMQHFNILGGHSLLRSLAQLGLSSIPFGRPLASLSGGEKTKTHLCSLVHREPSLLLLDEPTNHLDLHGINWLEKQLRVFTGSVIMVTHDRSLINNTSTRVSELSPITHSFQHFTGGYDAYLIQQEKERERLIQRRKAQETELDALSQRLNRTQNNPKTVRHRTDRDKLSYNARGERQQKGLGRQVKALQSKKSDLADNLVHVPGARKEVRIELGTPEKHVSLAAERLSYRYTDKELFSDVSFSLSEDSRLCITGPNGSGKTTLLKILAGLFEPETGHVSFSHNAKIGFLDQQQESIDLEQTPSELVREMADDFDESAAFRLLKKFGVSHGHDLDSTLDKLSVGTRRKVQLAGIVASGANVLLLDEPTNHLDIISLEQIEDQLRVFPGIVIAVSHDRYFIDKLKARVLEIGKKKKRGKNVNKKK